MYKTFFLGVILGAALAAAAAFLLPVADLTREPSLITVRPNGGNVEMFRIRIPDDRIIAGSADSSLNVPASLEWPAGAPVDAEIFKLRNRDDTVIGLASRVTTDEAQSAVEWVLHLPARGSMYFPMATAGPGQAVLAGNLRAGTGEFLNRRGSLSERFVAASDDEGRIELESRLVASDAGGGR